MKLSEKQSRILAFILTCGVPALLLLPNIMLAIYGEMPFLAFCANLFLPAGLYMLFMTIKGRVGVNTLLLLPFMIFAGFQIVLLFLYSDGSIIGVDMFLNVATTNASEATELLANLKTAIAIVLVVYIPPLAAAIFAICKKVNLPKLYCPGLRRIAACIAAVGVVVVVLAKCFVAGYMVNEQLFPYNVICNLGIAVKRTIDSANYPKTSAGYTYEAQSTRPAEQREIYVAVIGETSRADNWQLCGYGRETNPRLSAVDADSICAFRNALSESNTTHKSVPLLLSPLTADNFKDELNYTRSVILAFKEAGFSTAYVSMQAHNGSYIDYFGAEADEVMYLREPAAGQQFTGHYDCDLLAPLDSLLARGNSKQLIVLHQYGSHFNYHDRYPAEDSYFTPDKVTDAKAANRDQLINAYDNTVRHTDRLLAGIVARLDSIDCLGGMIYTSDHGEDIYDDSRERFLHASPTPTFMQIHVPMVLYLNPQLRREHPEFHQLAHSRRYDAVSSSESYTPTLLHIAGIETPKADYSLALTSPDYEAVEQRRFLSDRNKSLTLDEAGFRRQDKELLEALERRMAELKKAE